MTIFYANPVGGYYFYHENAEVLVKWLVKNFYHSAPVYSSVNTVNTIEQQTGRRLYHISNNYSLIKDILDTINDYRKNVVITHEDE